MSVVLLWAMLSALDGGTPLPPARSPAAEDAEVVKHLELLEHLEEAADLELLHELATED